MTTEEKAETFDLIARALTNRWSDGRWSWWCRLPCGGPSRDTREEAVADLVEWAKRPINQRLSGDVRASSVENRVPGPFNQAEDMPCADAVRDTVELSTAKLRVPDASG